MTLNAVLEGVQVMDNSVTELRELNEWMMEQFKQVEARLKQTEEERDCWKRETQMLRARFQLGTGHS